MMHHLATISGRIIGRIIVQFMRGPENVASNSEPRKFFSRPLEAPSEVTFREAKSL